jgi:formylglycine-generating enzyme required for sulfatase activity
LRHWKHEAWLERTDESWAKDAEQRKQRLESIQKALASTQVAKPQWYFTEQGQEMVVIPGPVEFVMGSPPSEAGSSREEQQHRRRINRTFAIAAKPVTLRQYLRFDKGFAKHYIKRYAPFEECPVHGTDWFMAAGYCNWLSAQERIPEEEWCYETDSQGRVTKLRANSLSRKGYRLPTEAEWEYACRAGTVTSRYYGETEELLPKYAWYKDSAYSGGSYHSWPVGWKKPNDLGLFDMHGNLYSWCQESKKPYPKATNNEAIADEEDDLSVAPEGPRVERGGSYGNPARNIRSADRNVAPASNRGGNTGFRLARTFR